MRTKRINNDTGFRSLELHANRRLAAKGYQIEQHEGSSSWTGPEGDALVKFKLCYTSRGIFFGVRDEWATGHSVPLTRLGTDSAEIVGVSFTGQWVTNTDAGQMTIDSIISLFP